MIAAGCAIAIGLSPERSHAEDLSALAYTSDMPTKAMPTKALPPAALSGPTTCTSVPDFFTTNCVLSWYGITVYGTVDVGGGYQTHGAPFDKQFITGASYFLQKMNRTAMWGLAPNAMSQSNIGIKGKEPIAGDWSFIFALEAGFDPYSLQLANSPGSLIRNNGVPLNLQTTNGDSSRAGQFYNSVGYLGIASPVYGTLTVFRQNSLTLDGVLAYDPMGGSYAFSPIGFSGVTAGAGDTETARYSTAVKYRVDVGPFRAAALWQFGTYALNNGANGAWEGQLGADIRGLGAGTGVLSVDGIFTYTRDAVSLGISSAAGSLSNGVPIAPFAQGPLTATISNQTSFMGLAKYAEGPFKVYFGYEWIQFALPSDTEAGFTDIGGNPIGAIFANNTAINNVAFGPACGTGVCSEKILQVVWTGVKYAIRDNLDVIGAYYHYDQGTYTTANCSNPVAHSQCSGTMDAVSGVIDWRFAPKWDTYVGMMYSQMAGGLANGYLSRNNLDPTAGLRFRF
jgi:predicted porin